MYNKNNIMLDIFKEKYICALSRHKVIAICEFLATSSYDIKKDVEKIVLIKDEDTVFTVKDFMDIDSRYEFYNILTEQYSSCYFTVDYEYRSLRVHKGSKNCSCCENYEWFMANLEERNFEDYSAFKNTLENITQKNFNTKKTKCYLANLLSEHYICDITVDILHAIFNHLGAFSALENLKIDVYSATKRTKTYESIAFLDVLKSLDVDVKYIIDIDCTNKIRVKEQDYTSEILRQPSTRNFDWLTSQLSKKANLEYLCFMETVSRFAKSVTAESQRYVKENNDTDMNKEETNMNNKLFPDLKCGKVNSDSIKMSHLGIAVKNKENVFVAYDKAGKALTNVDVTSINGSNFLFQLPVQTSEVKVGDCILHNGSYFYVTGLSPLKGISYYFGTEDIIQLTANMFGFNFITKIVSMFDLTASGNSNMNMMLPLLMLDKENGLSSSNDTLKAVLMMSMMQQTIGQTQNNQANMSNMFSNPMMLLVLSEDNSDISSLMMMSMMQQQAATNINNNGGNGNA